MADATSMTFRVERQLQTAFVAACKAADTTAAQVLRAAMRQYLTDHAQPALFKPVGRPKPKAAGK